MGTKNNPGSYDCYANAHPDEPMFVLLARDVSSPYFVRAWQFLRAGMLAAAKHEMERAMVALLNARKSGRPLSDPKLAEARSCAAAMDDWHARGGIPNTDMEGKPFGPS